MKSIRIRKTSVVLSVLEPQTPLGHNRDCHPTGLGQFNSRGEYSDPHAASSVVVIIFVSISLHDGYTIRPACRICKQETFKLEENVISQ